jgi:hypothetical protein
VPTSAAPILSHTVTGNTHVICHDNHKGSQQRAKSAALPNEQGYSRLRTKKSSEVQEEFIEKWPLLCSLFLVFFICTYHSDIFNGIHVN